MIEINNLTINQINEEFIKRIIEKTLKEEKKEKADLSIALIGQGRMRELNKKYRKKNRVTDVLAFPESKVLMEKFKVGPCQKISGLGEIIICLREVKKNAKRLKTSFENEFTRVLIHGILHLLGYTHEEEKKEAEKMKEKENYYLSRFFQKEAGFIIFLLDFLAIVVLIAVLIFSFLKNKEILRTLLEIFK